MPELPEVEALRRGLLVYLPGRTITKVEIFKPKLVSGRGNVRVASKKKTDAFIGGLTGQKFKDIERRAKNLLFRFAGGQILLVHLKMTGQFVFVGPGGRRVDGGHPIEESETILPNKQTRIIFHLDSGTLYYNDTRQFGYLLFYPNEAAFQKDGHFEDHGPEPLSDDFTGALKKKKGILKPALMAQNVVAGLGNIYVDEVCFAAGVRPTRRIPSLTQAEIRNLYVAIRKILPHAIQLGGSSVSDHRLADGSRGNYAREHKVYGRTGKQCLVCATKLKTVQSAGRTTVFCPHCQK
jgi:formamidopyrimidine-DNA glycosylase